MRVRRLQINYKGTNCWQILNVVFRNFHWYRLWNGQLFCLLVMEQNWTHRFQTLPRFVMFQLSAVEEKLSRDFLKYFKDQITDILIFHLIFASDMKTFYLFASLIFYTLYQNSSDASSSSSFHSSSFWSKTFQSAI